MWRAFFIAVGIILLVLGLEFLVVDEAVLADKAFVRQSSSSDSVYDSYAYLDDNLLDEPAGPRKLNPPEWARWSLLSSGAVVLLYALSSRPAG